MAESVIIEKFGKGVGQLASEKTAKMILKELQRSGGGKGISTDVIKKAVSNNADAYKELDQSIKKTSKSYEEHKKKLGKFAKSVSDATAKLSSSIGGVASYIAKATNVVSLFNDTSTMIAKSGTDFTSSTDGVRSGMDLFGYTLSKANLTVDELSSITENYSRALNTFGVDTFGRVTNSITRHMNSFGISAEETAELVADLVDTQRFTSMNTKMTEEQRTKAIKESISATTEFSKRLGINALSLNKSVNEALKDDDIQIFIRTFAKNNRGIEQSLRSIATITGSDESQNLRDALMRVGASEITAREDVFKTLSTFAPSISSSLEYLNKAVQSGNIEEANKLTMDIIGNLASLSEDQIRLARIASEQGGMELIKLANEANVIFNQVNRKISQKELDRQAELGDAATRLAGNIKQVTEMFSRLGARILGSEGITKALKSFSDTVDNFIENEKVFDQIEKFLLVGIKSVSDMIGKATDKMLDPNFTILGWIKSNLGFEGEETISEFITRQIKSITWTDIGMVIAGGIGAGLAAGILKSIGNYLSGGKSDKDGNDKDGLATTAANALGSAGSVLIGFMTGFKDVLLMFSNPRILVGAGILSGSLATISTGISGAIKILSISDIEKLSSSLKNIELIDGQKLSNVGTGIVGLSKGLTLIGGGNLYKRFTDLFSGSEFADTITEISSLSSEANRINYLANSINNLVDALTKLSTVKNRTISTPNSSSYSNVKNAIIEASDDVKQTTKEIKRSSGGDVKSDRDILTQINKSMENQIQIFSNAVMLLQRNNDLARKMVKAIEEN